MRKWFSNLFLFFASMVICFLLVEQAYRFFLFGSASFSYARMSRLHEIGSSGLIQPSEFPEIVYELKPNLDTYFKLVPFRTNSHGLRDEEYSVAKPEGTYRIALIGDSFSVPEGVEIENAYHTILERRLNQLGSFEVINFSAGGYSLRQYLAIIKEKVLTFDPDLLMIGFCPQNDHKVPREEIFQRQFEPNPVSNSFFWSFVKMQVMRTAIREYYSRKRGKVVAGRTETFSEEQKKYLATMFDKLGAVSQQEDIPVVVVFLWHRYNQYWRTYSKQLAKMVTSRGIHFIDVSTPFKGKDLAEYVIHPLDPHPNARANRIFAERLYGYLRENLINDRIPSPQYTDTTRG